MSPTVSRPVLSPRAELQGFTCTFCWHSSLTPPRVIGRSARLACQPCYDAVLDLSICWVCGEVVVRGDDCVSLGWCFWHKACYGCLICGHRIVAHGLTVREVFDERGRVEEVTDEKGGFDLARSGRAVEIDSIPLCAHCYVEVGAEKMDEEEVVGGALRRTECRDGDLSQRRYDCGRLGVYKGLGPEQNAEHDNNPAAGSVPFGAAIYVSIRDPTTSAFKPSPTKPIPRWMGREPVQVEDADDVGELANLTGTGRARHPSQAELSLQRLSASATSTGSTPTPSTTAAGADRIIANAETSGLRPSAPIVAPQPLHANGHKVFRYNRIGFIDSESLKRPSSRLDRIREAPGRAESRASSRYMTPLEWPPLMHGDRRNSQELESHGDSQGTVIEQRGPPSQGQPLNQISAVSSSPSQLSALISPAQTPNPPTFARLSIVSEPTNLPQHPRLHRKSTILRAKISGNAQPLSSDHTAIPMSSEFLDRYGIGRKGSGNQLTSKPSSLLRKKSSSPRQSSTTPSSRHDAESFLSRLTRNSGRAEATTGRVDETTVMTATAEGTDTPKRLSFDSISGSVAPHDGPVDGAHGGERKSLQAELRRLFGR